jgi:hypothetical protein
LKENKYSEELKSALEAQGLHQSDVLEILLKFNGTEIQP